MQQGDRLRGAADLCKIAKSPEEHLHQLLPGEAQVAAGMVVGHGNGTSRHGERQQPAAR